MLGRGLLGGHWTASGDGDMRTRSPRFSGENLTRNLDLVESLRAVAEDLGISAAQAAIAWVAARGTDVVALIGARTRIRLQEALGGIDVDLSEAQLSRIESAVPADRVAGDRYPAAHMASLDSER